MPKKHTIYFNRPKKRTTYYYRPGVKVSPVAQFKSAYITAETREALNGSREMREQVWDELHKSLQDYWSLNVRADRILRIIAGTTLIVQKLQRATALSFSWRCRPVRLCLDFGSPGLYFPSMSSSEFSRLYYRQSFARQDILAGQDSLEVQGSLCTCMVRGRPSMEGDGCFCAWLSHHLRWGEGIAPRDRLALARTEDYWNLEQSAAMFAWGNLRTLSLLAHLVGHERARVFFEEGANVFQEKVEAAMETGRDHMLVFEGNLYEYR